MAVSVELLLLAPELAVLETLTAALAASVDALCAAHAQLEDADFPATAQPPLPQVCMAEALIAQARALEHMLSSYRTLITQQPVWARAQAADQSLSS